MRLLGRASRLVAQAILIGISVALLFWAVTDWSMSDAGSYWQAALRLREGEPLYPPITDVESSEVYRYSPWFAWLTVPLTFLPLPVAAFIWSAVLLGASVVAILPLARRGAWLLALFFGSVLVGISAIGNVQPLLIAGLVWGLERRAGPLAIAAAASLKAVPILFSVVYLGRRQWGRFAASVALTALLVAPFLLYDTSNYVTNVGFAGMLITYPPIYVVVVGIGLLATIRLAPGPYGWLAAGTTVALALPRFFLYDITFLLPGTLPAAPATGTLWSWHRRAKGETLPDPDPAPGELSPET